MIVLERACHGCACELSSQSYRGPVWCRECARAERERRNAPKPEPEEVRWRDPAIRALADKLGVATDAASDDDALLVAIAAEVRKRGWPMPTIEPQWRVASLMRVMQHRMSTEDAGGTDEPDEPVPAYDPARVPDRLRCPDCSATFVTPMGLGLHHLNQHDARARVLAGL